MSYNCANVCRSFSEINKQTSTHPGQVADIELISSPAAVVGLEVGVGVGLGVGRAAVAALRRLGAVAVPSLGGDHVIVQIGVSKVLQPPAGTGVCQGRPIARASAGRGGECQTGVTWG